MHHIEEIFNLKSQIKELQNKIQKLESFRAQAIEFAASYDDFVKETLTDISNDLFREKDNSNESKDSVVNVVAYDLLDHLTKKITVLDFAKIKNDIILCHNFNNFADKTPVDWSISIFDNHFVCKFDQSFIEFDDLKIVKNWAVSTLVKLIEDKRTGVGFFK